MRLIRVFPRKTKATPDDDLSFTGPPDLFSEADKRRAAGETRTMQADDQSGRLPDGARFDVQYFADKQSWAGTLTVDGKVFRVESGGVRRLLSDLDAMYRASLKPEAEEVA